MTSVSSKDLLRYTVGLKENFSYKSERGEDGAQQKKQKRSLCVVDGEDRGAARLLPGPRVPLLPGLALPLSSLAPKFRLPQDVSQPLLVQTGL